MNKHQNLLLANWIARIAVGAVFAMNVSCALAFILQPEAYAAGFELSGIPGKMLVRGFGILFLMWNATYPPVLLRPSAQPTLFATILAQQAIGILGETWILLKLPPGHPALYATGLRFTLFDSLGLLLMGAAFVLLQITVRRARLPSVI
ncbi:MAG: hypothetical protein JW726_08340 [Anaerolineales bacterium]|nr:hypothetical protein [Anaerolineales bacterium]